MTHLTISKAIRTIFPGQDPAPELLRAVEAYTFVVGLTGYSGFWKVVPDTCGFASLRKRIEIRRNNQALASGCIDFDLDLAPHQGINFEAPEARIIVHGNQMMTCMEAIGDGLLAIGAVKVAHRLIERRKNHPELAHLLPWGLVEEIALAYEP